MKTIQTTLCAVFLCLGGLLPAYGQYALMLTGPPCAYSNVPIIIVNSTSSQVTSNIWNIQWSVNGATVPGVNGGYELYLYNSGLYNVSFCIGTSASNCTNYTASATFTATMGNGVTQAGITGPQTICVGQSVTYTVTATGVGGDGIYNSDWGGQWFANGQATGVTSQTFISSTIVPGSIVQFSGGYVCGGIGASLQTNSGPVPMLYATGNPAQFCAADAANVLNVSAGNSFQWKYDGVSVSGANTSSYHPMQSGNYSVSVINNCANTASELGPINVAMQANCLPPAVWSLTGTSLATTNNDLVINGNTRLSGKLLTKGLKITLTPGTDAFPDYVFDKDYRLMPLETLENYISTYHHLPEAPSAKEAENEGMDMKQMNLLLLKKVEELTLHVIKMNERIEAQQKEITTLQKAK